MLPERRKAMKRLLLLAMLLPFAGFAQPINTMNNPNQPGYQIPSQQRMQTQMQSQQIQQKGMLNQQLQTQTRMQQQHMENQINTNTQRVLQSQPGELNSGQQQMLPNTNGGMLSGTRNPDSSLNKQHMLSEKKNGDMLKPSSTPQPNVPLKTIGP